MKKTLLIGVLAIFVDLYPDVLEAGLCEDRLIVLASDTISIGEARLGGLILQKVADTAVEAWTSGVRTRHGALLLNSDGKIIGRGRTRRSTEHERSHYNLIDWSQRALVAFQQGGNRIFPTPSLDHSTHAEQAALIDARQRKERLSDSSLFVAPIRLKGGHVEVGRRSHPFFTCQKCAIWAEFFGVRRVYVLTERGWEAISTPSLYVISTDYNFRGTRYWERQRAGREMAGVENIEWLTLDRALSPED